MSWIKVFRKVLPEGEFYNCSMNDTGALDYVRGVVGGLPRVQYRRMERLIDRGSCGIDLNSYRTTLNDLIVQPAGLA